MVKDGVKSCMYGVYWDFIMVAFVAICHSQS